MPNPQQPELARSRKAAPTADDALPARARRSAGRRGNDAPGPVPAVNEPGHHHDVVPDKPLVPPAAYRVHDEPAEVRGAGEASSYLPGDPVDAVRYRFRFDRLLVPAAAAAGVTPFTAWVDLDEERLEIRFGPWVLRTPRENVAGAEVTGPYRLWKVGGPPRLSLRDRGVTFATSTHQGTCIRFHEPVPAALPGGLLRHPAATVTVTNPPDLARRLGG